MLDSFQSGMTRSLSSAHLETSNLVEHAIIVLTQFNANCLRRQK